MNETKKDQSPAPPTEATERRPMPAEYRKLTPIERAELDAFYSGMSTAIWAMFYPELRDDSGWHSQVREAMGTIDPREFYLWARRNNDVMLPWLRRYMHREARLAAALASASPETPTRETTR